MRSRRALYSLLARSHTLKIPTRRASSSAHQAPSSSSFGTACIAVQHRSDAFKDFLYLSMSLLSHLPTYSPHRLPAQLRTPSSTRARTLRFLPVTRLDISSSVPHQKEHHSALTFPLPFSHLEATARWQPPPVQQHTPIATPPLPGCIPST